MADPIVALNAALPPDTRATSRIGKGGQGSVFVGTWKGRPAAVKVFGPCDPERIRRELDLLRSPPPGVVAVLDHHEIELDGLQTHVAVYEYVAGRNMRDVIKDPAPVAMASLLRLSVDIGGAIDGLWLRRVVHRDVKPENIIEVAGDGYKLVDLGIAQHLALPTITIGGPPGTPGYRSPEQALGRRKFTVHADVFCLGITLFEVATKRHPWNRDESRMLKAPPTSILDVRPDLDPPFARTVHQMLQLKVWKRPAILKELFSSTGRS